MENLSEHLSLSEVIYSPTAKRLNIDNTPTDEHLDNLKILAEKVFELIRVHFNKPIYISSGYRSKKLNKATPGASSTSQHSLGEALDLDQDGKNNGISNKEVFEYIKENLDFDQLIAEGLTGNGNINWVHVSYKANGTQRKQILLMRYEKNKPIYESYSDERFKELL